MGFDEIVMKPLGLVDPVEIYSLRAKMLRVYTKQYVVTLMRDSLLRSISYSEDGLGLVCY